MCLLVGAAIWDRAFMRFSAAIWNRVFSAAIWNRDLECLKMFFVTCHDL